MSDVFTWQYQALRDIDQPGIVKTYTTTMWIPDVQKTYDPNITVKKALSGKIIVVKQYNPKDNWKIVSPPSYTLSWKIADPDFLPHAEEAFIYGYRVTVSFIERIDFDAEQRWEPKTHLVSIVKFNPQFQEGRLTSLELGLQDVGGTA